MNASFPLEFNLSVRFSSSIHNPPITSSISSEVVPLQLPPLIEVFITSHPEQPLLCELAAWGRKSFDEGTLDRWLTFLDENGQTTSPGRWEELLIHLKNLDSIGTLWVWFLYYFEQEIPKIEILFFLIKDPTDFSTLYREFFLRFKELSKRTTLIVSEEQLLDTWEFLQSETDAFFGSSLLERSTLFQDLQFFQLLQVLIQLWYQNIQKVKTLPLLSESGNLFGERLNQFIEFGRKAIERKVITHSSQQLLELFNAAYENIEYASDKRPFSKEHWLIPRSRYPMHIPNEDEYLNVIYQNLLKTSNIAYEPEVTILPASLARTLNLFQKNNPPITKRYSQDRAIFISFSENHVVASLNIPIQNHSCVVTIRQNQGSEIQELTAYWRVIDLPLSYTSDLFSALPLFTNLQLMGTQEIGFDFSVTFKAQSDEAITVFSRAIFEVNRSFTNYTDLFDTLVKTLYAIQEEDADFETKSEEVSNALWKDFLITGTMHPLLESDRFSYVNRRGLWPELFVKVADELEGKSTSMVYSDLFLSRMEDYIPKEKLQPLIWKNVTGIQTIKFAYLPSSYGNELLQKLLRDDPEKALSYCRKNNRSKSLKKLMMGLIDSVKIKTETTQNILSLWK